LKSVEVQASGVHSSATSESGDVSQAFQSITTEQEHKELMKEKWLIQQHKEELATLTNLMLPTQAIKVVESYHPYLTLTTESRFDKSKDSDKEKVVTWSKDLTFLPLLFIAHSHRKETKDRK